MPRAHNTQVATLIGIATYFWIVDFPEKAHHGFYFFSKLESEIAVRRIQKDRGDGNPTPFSWREILKHFLDPKIYGFAATFFLLVCVVYQSQSAATETCVESGFHGIVVLPPYYVRPPSLLSLVRAMC